MSKLPEEIMKLFNLARQPEEELRLPAIESLITITEGLALKQEKYEDLLNTFFLMVNADSREKLVKLIIRAATRITDSEVATFFQYFADKETLRFSSLIGATADTLQDLEIPAKTGIVGKVVQTKAPLIVNDVSREPLFNPETDKKTGFKTRSILAVPVLDKEEKLIGVIEVLNRKDGSYNEEDQGLLNLLAQNVAISYKLFGF